MKKLMIVLVIGLAKMGFAQTDAAISHATYKNVTSFDDYESITVVNTTDETEGLVKIGHISAMVLGSKIYTNKAEVEKKAFNKLKMAGAMIGASVIRMPNMVIKSKSGGALLDFSADQELTGIAYAMAPLDMEAFKKVVSANAEYNSVNQIKINNRDAKFSTMDRNVKFRVNTIKKEDNVIMIAGDLKGESAKKFQVVSFDHDTFDVYFFDAFATYRMKFKIN
ncbi:MAG: hypothetical protein WCL14_11585 [Bacteroidota bacterium]